MKEVKCPLTLILMVLAMVSCVAPKTVPATIPSIPERTIVATATLSTPTRTALPTPSKPMASGITGGLVEKLELEDLALGADCILVGTVENVRSEWDNDRTLIYTLIEFSIENTVKGCLNQAEVTIRVPGGQVGDESLEVSTAPTFEAGEKALVFLEMEDKGSLRVLGGFQGKVTVQNGTVLDPATSLRDFVEDIQSILGKSN